MRRVLKFALCLALIGAVSAGEALAKSRKAAPAGQPAASGDNDFPIPLPQNLTTNNDWLDDGAAAAAAKKKKYMGPNAQANDNYFTQQQNFSNHDPLAHTEAESTFFNW
jgi:hypothetical protein